MQAGDEIVKLASGPEQMTVAEVDALLYLPGHPRQQLLRALRIPALSPGWQASFRALLDARTRQRQRRPRADEPAAGLARLPPADASPRSTRESDSVISIRLEDPAGAPLPAAPARPVPHAARPARRASSGRCCATTRSRGRPAPATTGSPSSASTTAPPAAICTPGSPSATELDIAAPRGTFILDRTHAPVLLISAGIGATPVLAMLQALAAEHSEREIWWLHGARSGRDHSFAAEARALLASLPNVRAHVCYSRPGPDDLEGRDFDSAGRLTASLLAELEPPRDAEAYLCGPAPFMDEISAGLAAMGIDASRIHTEPFGPAPGLTPGIARDARAGAPPARRRTRRRPDDRVRPQQPRHPVEQRLRQPARARRGLRRARPLVVPHRRLPQLRDDAHRRRPRLQPRPGRAPRRRKRAHLLLAAARRRRARSVTGRQASLGVPRHRPVGGVQRRRLRHHHHPARSGDQATDRRREPAARPPRALAVLSRLRRHVPVHRTGVGQPPRHVRPHPRSRPGRTAPEHPAADGRGVPSVRHLRPRRGAAQRTRPANRRRLLWHRVRR